MLGVGGIAGGSDQEIAAMRVVCAEEFEGGAVKRFRIPLALDGVHFIAAVSGRKFRIPFICRITDWVLNYIDKTLAKAEKAKKKKV